MVKFFLIGFFALFGHFSWSNKKAQTKPNNQVEQEDSEEPYIPSLTESLNNISSLKSRTKEQLAKQDSEEDTEESLNRSPAQIGVELGSSRLIFSERRKEEVLRERKN